MNEEEIKNLLSRIELLEAGFNSIVSKSEKYKPYQCPNCEGNGIRWWRESWQSSTCGRKGASCHTCKGKGIVWRD